jgi:hypothetical protein
MKHPDESILALQAGGDLGPLAAWRTRRHLARCERCRAGVAEFDAVRAAIPELAELTGVSWNRLAAGMKANIRAGLAAGDRVPAGERSGALSPAFGRMRVALVCASLALAAAFGLFLQRSMPDARLARPRGVELQSVSNGVQVREGETSLRLLHAGAEEKDVTYTSGAQGSMRASYVDSETEYVTVASVYAN